MKDSEFDFYRWLGYGLALLLLAIGAIFIPVVLWIFIILLVIVILDIGYSQYSKYRFYPKSGKKK